MRKAASHWELMTNELLLSFSKFFICVLKASLKTLQESFPIFLLIVDMTDLRLLLLSSFFFLVILDKSQQFIFFCCSDSFKKTAPFLTHYLNQFSFPVNDCFPGLTCLLSFGNNFDKLYQ
jgi:hypothetical protein